MYFQSASSMNNFRANLCVTPFFGGKHNEDTLLTLTYSSVVEFGVHVGFLPHQHRK